MLLSLSSEKKDFVAMRNSEKAFPCRISASGHENHSRAMPI
jgi:hypothetical protein